MSNNVAGSPWKIDTATAVSAIASGRIFQIYDIIWTSASVSGAAVVQDIDGTLKWEAATDAVTQHIHDSFDPPITINGLTVPTLAGGTLKIYVKQMR